MSQSLSEQFTVTFIWLNFKWNKMRATWIQCLHQWWEVCLTQSEHIHFKPYHEIEVRMFCVNCFCSALRWDSAGEGDMVWFMDEQEYIQYLWRLWPPKPTNLSQSIDSLRNLLWKIENISYNLKFLYSILLSSDTSISSSSSFLALHWLGAWYISRCPSMYLSAVPTASIFIFFKSCSTCCINFLLCLLLLFVSVIALYIKFFGILSLSIPSICIISLNHFMWLTMSYPFKILLISKLVHILHMTCILTNP